MKGLLAAMPTRHNEALLIKAPAGRHFCQFHREPEALSKAVALFTGTGLQRGDGVMIIATPEHSRLFLADLDRMEIDAAAHQSAGELVLLDAEMTLKQFMHDGMPDWNRFRHAIGTMLDGLTAK